MLVLAEKVPEEYHDVVIVGTGMAGLSAAVAAREAGAEVLVIEKAPFSNKGGNTRFAGGGLRRAGPRYSEEEFFNDLMRITRGRANEELGRFLVNNSQATVEWLTNLGVEWLPPGGRKDSHGKDVVSVNFAKEVPFEGHLGGGNGLLHMMLDIAQKKGAKIVYETKAETLLIDNKRRVIGVRVLTSEGYRDLKAKGVVLASGGFQGNTEMRVRYIGKFADGYVLRGSRYNTGDGINMALDIGAQPIGQWGDHHSAVLDARSPKVEAGETNINTFPFTIIVNKDCQRFLDEGEDWHQFTYVKTGKAILSQPEGIGYCIFDSKVRDNGLVFGLREKYLPPIQANSIRELAGKVGLNPDALEETINKYNAAVQPGEFDPDRLDGKRTVGIDPPKSNWTLPIDKPPFYCFPVTGGVTFTFGGLKVNTKAQVIDTEDRLIPGLYAAGEIIGDLFYYNYPGGSSLMRCAVFGRVAAANAVQGRP